MTFSVSSDAGETQWGIGAAKSKRVREGDPSALSPPWLRCAGNIIEVELWLCTVQVEGRGQDPVVAGQSGERCFQSPCSPEQMPCGSLGGGDSQASNTFVKEPLDGSIFSRVTQRRGGGVGIHICHICWWNSSISEGCWHASVETVDWQLKNTSCLLYNLGLTFLLLAMISIRIDNIAVTKVII